MAVRWFEGHSKMTLKDGERSGRFAMLAKNPASVQGLAFILIVPLTFGSNVFAPTVQLPGWLQA
jgi:hypothetical protein